MKTILALTATALLVGCAATSKPMHPIQRVNEGGRYSQLAWNGVALMQVDWPTPELCAAALKGSASEDENPGMSITCSQRSLAAEMPFGAVAENDILGTKSPTHFRSNDFCLAMQDVKVNMARFRCTGPK